jgi:protein-disulfide isomerase
MSVKNDPDRDRENDPSPQDGDEDAPREHPPVKKVRRRRPEAERGRSRPEARPVVPSAPAASTWRSVVVAVVALTVGLLGGWVVRDQYPAGAGEAPGVGPDPGAAPTGSAAAQPSAACDGWVKALCDGAGQESESCTLAEAAAELLPAAACREATAALPTTLSTLKQARSTCTELMSKLCTDLGEGTGTCKMVKEKTPAMPTSQCQQMMAEYDRVLAELKQVEAANAPLTEEAAAAQRAGNAPSFGPADAKVAIVEYSDFECPFCSRAAEVVHGLKERYGERVRFVFRQYPLPMHDNAMLAAEASLAAHAQGKFWPYHDLLFANQRALDRASLEKYAKEAGLDLAKFKKALDEHTYADAVRADMKLGEQIGVQGTPTMIVGTKRVENPTELSAVTPLVDAELAGAPAK